jgi:hypothetical protein
MPYEPHPHLVTPPDDTVLWRYMDFARFAQLLENRQLWFARADQFDDPLEGTLTDGEIRFEQTTDSGQPQFRDAKSDPLAQMMRRSSYVNCWRMGSSESLAMWDLYGKGSGIVAITTTVGSLKQQFSGYPRQVFMAQIRYVEWNAPNTLAGMLDLITRKDISYAHEAEMRAFLWDVAFLPEPNPASSREHPVGQMISIDPQELISEIWIGPREKSWIQPLVEKFVARYGMHFTIKASDKMSIRRQVRFRI